MSEDETIPKELCAGELRPMTCVRYDSKDSKGIINMLQVSKNSPIFLSQGDHQDLLRELSGEEILFSRTTLWFMPVEYGSDLPLRLDSRVFLYKESKSGYYIVYETYAVRGGTPIVERLI